MLIGDGGKLAGFESSSAKEAMLWVSCSVPVSKVTAG